MPNDDYERLFLADERAMLETMLNLQRAEIAAVCAGLSEEQARERLVPSLTTPLALVTHATFVEKVWFWTRVGGLSRAEAGIGETVESSFDTTGMTVAEALTAYDDTCARSRAFASRAGLDDTYPWRDGAEVNLRFIYVHCIQELARHCGHGDILREQLLA